MQELNIQCPLPAHEYEQQQIKKLIHLVTLFSYGMIIVLFQFEFKFCEHELRFDFVFSWKVNIEH